LIRINENYDGNDKLKISGKSRSARMEVENSLRQGKKMDKLDEEIGKVKDSIVNQFENIIHIQITTASRKKKKRNLMRKRRFKFSEKE